MADTFHICDRDFFIGGHASTRFIIGFAHKIAPLSELVAVDLLNIAEWSSRLSAENRELRRRARKLSDVRQEEFITAWMEYHEPHSGGSA